VPLSLILAAFLVFSALNARAQQVPFLTASTVKGGTVISNEFGARVIGGESYAAHDQSTQGIVMVKVELRTFSKLQVPYHVECFFLAHDPEGHRFVYDVIKTPSDKQSDLIYFTARNLFEGSSSNNTRGDALSGSDGSTIMLYTSLTQKVPGSIIEGWIVRVVNAGRIVRIESSLPELRSLATNQPAAFDDLAAAAKASDLKQ
jgi:hypothetical protein